MDPTNKLAYIIPSHAPNDGLRRAIESVLKQTEKSTVIVSTTPEIADSITDLKANNIHVLTTEDATDYQTLVNGAIEFAKTDEGIGWVSILEHDDELLPGATALFTAYHNHFTDTQMFAGLTLMCEPRQDDSPPALRQLMNEACWAPGVMEEPGLFDLNAFMRMNFVFLNGCFISLDVFDEIGGLKSNMKYFADYEFMLRVIYNGMIVRGIPKATHYHFVGGEGISRLGTLDRDEASFWANVARKEYFFEFDRELTYEPPKGIKQTGA